MPNRDPENFVSFNDFMGLNDQTGQDAMAKLLASKNGTEADPAKIEEMAKAHRRMAFDQGYGVDAQQNDGSGVMAMNGMTDPSGGTYGSTADAATNGLASYGSFIKDMGSEQSRQLALQKLYGGRATALDSSLVGAAGSGQLSDANKGYGELSKTVQGEMNKADLGVQQGMASRSIMDRVNSDDTAKHQKFIDDLNAAKSQTAIQNTWKQGLIRNDIAEGRRNKDGSLTQAGNEYYGPGGAGANANASMNYGGSLVYDDKGGKGDKGIAGGGLGSYTGKGGGSSPRYAQHYAAKGNKWENQTKTYEQADAEGVDASNAEIDEKKKSIWGFLYS